MHVISIRSCRRRRWQIPKLYSINSTHQEDHVINADSTSLFIHGDFISCKDRRHTQAVSILAPTNSRTITRSVKTNCLIHTYYCWNELILNFRPIRFILSRTLTITKTCVHSLYSVQTNKRIGNDSAVSMAVTSIIFSTFLSDREW